jgi:hypothetical protein
MPSVTQEADGTRRLPHRAAPRREQLHAPLLGTTQDAAPGLGHSRSPRMFPGSRLSLSRIGDLEGSALVPLGHDIATLPPPSGRGPRTRPPAVPAAGTAGGPRPDRLTGPLELPITLPAWDARFNGLIRHAVRTDWDLRSPVELALLETLLRTRYPRAVVARARTGFGTSLPFDPTVVAYRDGLPARTRLAG